MSIVWAGCIVTKTLLFHTYYSCAGSVIGCALTITLSIKCASMIINLPVSTHLSPCGAIVKTQEWPPHNT
jgi:hypothetical protein